MIHGIPEGSILGPRLFITYINDMCNVSSFLKCILFADDTTISRAGNDIKLLNKEVYVCGCGTDIACMCLWN